MKELSAGAVVQANLTILPLVFLRFVLHALRITY